MDERLRAIGARAWSLLGIFGVTAVVLFVIWRVRVIFPPLIIAATIVFLLNPIVNRLNHRGIPRAVAAALTYLAVVVGLGGIGLALTPLVGGQISQLREDFPEIRQRVEDYVDDRGARQRSQRLADQLVLHFQDSIQPGLRVFLEDVDVGIDLGDPYETFDPLTMTAMLPIDSELLSYLGRRGRSYRSPYRQRKRLRCHSARWVFPNGRDRQHYRPRAGNNNAAGL